MDTAQIVDVLQESVFLIAVFAIFLVYTSIKGRQAITNLILGLYFALLISVEFPYYDLIMGTAADPKTRSILMLCVFAVFTVIATLLFARITPREFDEKLHESLGKKILLSVAATVLVMTYSYHALPVTDIIHPGSPINYLFGSSQSFFYWLITPIAILFIT